MTVIREKAVCSRRIVYLASAGKPWAEDAGAQSVEAENARLRVELEALCRLAARE
jgi:hypothetical protein